MKMPEVMAAPIPDINLFRALEVFVSVVELGQVSSAAEALGMTQSAASQQIRNLETTFGVALFDRTQRPLRPTHAGEALHRRAFRILNEVADIKHDFRRLARTAVPILRVGLLPSIATTLTAPLTDHVTKACGIPELSLIAGLGNDLAPMLSAGKIDVAVVADSMDRTDGFVAHDILTESFALVLPPDYAGDAADVESLAASLPLIRFSAASPVGRRTDQHLQRLRLNLPRVMEADRASMVVAGVSAGRGFAILSPTLLLDAVQEGMALRIEPLPFKGFTRTIGLRAPEGDIGAMAADMAHICVDELKSAINRLLPAFPIATWFAARDGNY